MMRGILVLFLLLFIAGGVSAAAIAPVAIKQTIQPAAIIPVSQTAAVTFNADVKGVVVYLDGALAGPTEAESQTPITRNAVTAGSHTATFRLAGYQDSVMSFTVTAGKPQTISAQMKAAPRAVALVHDVTLKATILPTGSGVPVLTTTTAMVTTTAPGEVPVRQITSLPSAAASTGAVGHAGPLSGDAQGSAPGGFLSSLFGIFSGIFAAPAPAPAPSVTLTGPTIPPGYDPHLDAIRVARVIGKDARVYIGEEGLDATHALNQAAGILTAPAYDAPPALTRIGWWPDLSLVATTAPSRTVDLGTGSRYKSFTVSPADFVGYSGRWYLLGAGGLAPANSDAVVFTVQEPAIVLTVENDQSHAPVQGASVKRGTPLRFGIKKNIAVQDGSTVKSHRSPLTGTRSDGFITLEVTTPSGAVLHELAVTTDAGSAATESLRQSCWLSTVEAPDCRPGYTWSTGAAGGNGTGLYPPGNYSVRAISWLNNMADNYRNAGQIYTGKTASEPVTFTLV